MKPTKENRKKRDELQKRMQSEAGESTDVKNIRTKSLKGSQLIKSVSILD